MKQLVQIIINLHHWKSAKSGHKVFLFDNLPNLITKELPACDLVFQQH
jgi:hypothetical protein